MSYALGAAAGLIWGTLAALLNVQINKRALAKNSANALLAANLLRTLVDIAALAAVFLLRKALPFHYETALAGTAAALSIIAIVAAFRLSRPDK